MKKLAKLFIGTLALAMIATGCKTTASTTTPEAAPTKATDEAKPATPATPADPSAAKDPSKGEKIELRFSWWGSETRHEALEAVTKLYTEKYPNVTIKVEYGAWDGWTQTVLTQLTGKTEPDIVQINYNWIHSFGKGKNVFYNLNELTEYLDTKNWDDEQIQAMTVGGELAAVPHGVTARANLYNKALFAENKIEYPTTYEELLAAGKVIGKDNTENGAENKYVLTNIGKFSTDLFIAQMLYDATGKVMQTEGKINYSAEEVTATFEQFKAFEDASAFPTFAQEDPIQNESNPVWTSGRSGSVYEWIGTMDKYLASYKGGEAKDEISVAPYIIPKTGDKVSVFVKPSLGYSVSRNSKHPEVAADFINFMFTDEAAIKLIGTQLGVSSNKVSNALQESEGMVKGAMKEGFDLLATYDKVVMDPYFEDENVRGERYIAIEQFRTGKVSASEAAKIYIEKQQAQLDKLYK